MTGTTAETTTARTDSEIEQIHHVEIYVANVHQAAYFYGKVLGFEVVGELALEPPARRDRVSLALARDEVRLLLTAPLTSTSEIAAHLHLHGEGIKDVAFAVRGLDAVFERATSRGARSMLEPADLAASGVASGVRGRLAVVRGWGELVHSVIETPDGVPLWNATRGGDRGHEPPDTALEAVDHVAIAVGDGELEAAAAFYCQAFGFSETYQQNVSTEYSAMRSKVVGAPNRAVQFPLVEPAQGRRTSQVQAFLHSHEGPGAQHLAFRSSDIVKSVDALRAGMDFLPTPAAYLRHARGARRRTPGRGRKTAALRRARRSRRQRPAAADLHQTDRQPADVVHRSDRAPRRRGVRQRQHQGAVRSSRTAAGQLFAGPFVTRKITTLLTSQLCRPASAARITLRPQSDDSWRWPCTISDPITTPPP